MRYMYKERDKEKGNKEGETVGTFLYRGTKLQKKVKSRDIPVQPLNQNHVNSEILTGISVTLHYCTLSHNSLLSRDTRAIPQWQAKHILPTSSSLHNQRMHGKDSFNTTVSTAHHHSQLWEASSPHQFEKLRMSNST